MANNFKIHSTCRVNDDTGALSNCINFGDAGGAGGGGGAGGAGSFTFSDAAGYQYHSPKSILESAKSSYLSPSSIQIPKIEPLRPPIEFMAPPKIIPNIEAINANIAAEKRKQEYEQKVKQYIPQARKEIEEKIKHGEKIGGRLKEAAIIKRAIDIVAQEKAAKEAREAQEKAFDEKIKQYATYIQDKEEKIILEFIKDLIIDSVISISSAAVKLIPHPIMKLIAHAVGVSLTIHETITIGDNEREFLQKAIELEKEKILFCESIKEESNELHKVVDFCNAE